MLRTFLFLLSLTIALLSGSAALREYRVALFAGDSLEMQIMALGDPQSGQGVALPLTWRGQQALLAGCSTLQFSTLFRLQLAETQMGVQQRCHATAAHVLAHAPTVGLAYLVQAAALAAWGDDKGRDAALTRAQRSAPLEGWQAIRRVTLALPAYARLDPPALAALEADIRFLLRSPWGADSLSALYAQARQNRAFIAAVVQTAPAGDQRRLVNRLRAGLRG